MGKGLPKWAIREAKKRGARNIFAYAWTLVKRKGKRRKSKTTRTSNPRNTKRKVRRMVRRYRRGRRKGGKSMVRTAFKMIRLGALVGGGIQSYQDGAAQGGPLNGVKCALTGYGGIDIYGKFAWHVLARHWTPYLAACGATYGIPKLVSIIRRL